MVVFRPDSIEDDAYPLDLLILAFSVQLLTLPFDITTTLNENGKIEN